MQFCSNKDCVVKMAQHFCPVCGLKIARPAYTDGVPSLDICPCCLFQFGFDDLIKKETFDSWRAKWIRNGAQWSKSAISSRPVGWDAKAQLRNIGVDLDELR